MACLDVLGLCLLIRFTRPRMARVRDTRAAEHTWLLTEFSNRLGAGDLNLLAPMGGQAVFVSLGTALLAPFSLH